MKQPPQGQGRHASRAGSTATRVLLLLLALALVAGGFAWAAKSRQSARRCTENLHQIYAILEMYEVRNGTLPHLDFYPDDVRGGPGSLRALVEREGVGGDLCVCPSSPRILREAGLSYLWNVALNGQRLAGRSEPVWMLVEIHALSDQVPAPHRGRYHILYTDGRVVASRRAPEDLRAHP